MRSAAQLRQRWLDQVPRMMTRPGMWAHDGFGFQIVAVTLLGELCFVDERDHDHDDVRAVLSRFGKLGVNGPFAAVFGDEHSYVAEVASVFAEQFHRWVTWRWIGCSTSRSGTVSAPACQRGSPTVTCGAARSRPSTARPAW